MLLAYVLLVEDKPSIDSSCFRSDWYYTKNVFPYYNLKLFAVLGFLVVFFCFSDSTTDWCSQWLFDDWNTGKIKQQQ